MLKKKVLSLALSCAMLFCYMPSVAFADATTFVDMPSDWSTEALSNAVANGLIKGYEQEDGLYIKPSGNLTRAQLAAVVNRAFGSTEKASLAGVNDVASDAWYAADVAKALKMGTLAKDSNVRPDDKVTRQEAFTILARAFKMECTDANHAELNKFADADAVAAWAKAGVCALVSEGYVNGSNGNINPKANMTRAEFAVIMNNLVKKYIATAGTVELGAVTGNVMVNVADVTLKNADINGSLVVGDGVGNGDLTLDNVKVAGDLVVRGGGVNSIVIKGNSSIGKVIVAKVDGNVRVAVEGEAKVEVVVVADGKDDVKIEGKVETLTVVAETPVVVQNAEIKNVEVQAKAEVTIDKTATVTNVTVTEKADVAINGTVTNVVVEKAAAGTEVEISKNAKVEKVEAKGETTLGGEGSANKVTGDATTSDGKDAVTGGSTGGGGGSSSGGSSSGGGSVVTTNNVVVRPAGHAVTGVDTTEDNYDYASAYKNVGVTVESSENTATIKVGTNYKFSNVPYALKNDSKFYVGLQFDGFPKGTESIEAFIENSEKILYSGSLNEENESVSNGKYIEYFVIGDVNGRYDKKTWNIGITCYDNSGDVIGTVSYLITRAPETKSVESTVVMRPNGVATDKDYDYTAGYAKAGVEVVASGSNAEILVKPNYLFSKVDNELKNDNKFYVGLQFNTPELDGVKYAKYDGNLYDLTSDVAPVYNGNFIEYFGIGTNDSNFKDAEWELAIEWLDSEYNYLGTSTYTVERTYEQLSAVVGVRPAGVGINDMGLSYADKYEAAGIEVISSGGNEGGFTVKSNYNPNNVDSFLVHDDSVYVGLQFEKAHNDATRATLCVDGVEGLAISLTEDGDNCVSGNVVEYFKVGSREDSIWEITEKDCWAVMIEWYDVDKYLGATEYRISRKVERPELRVNTMQRNDGPAVDYDGEYNYMVAYRNAGLFVSCGWNGETTITVEKEYSYKETPKQLKATIDDVEKVYVGIQFDTAHDDAKYVTVRINDEEVYGKLDLSTDGENVVKGCFTEYFSIGTADDTNWTIDDKVWNVSIDWYLKDGTTIIGTTEYTVERIVEQSSVLNVDFRDDVAEFYYYNAYEELGMSCEQTANKEFTVSIDKSVFESQSIPDELKKEYNEVEYAWVGLAFETPYAIQEMARYVKYGDSVYQLDLNDEQHVYDSCFIEYFNITDAAGNLAEDGEFEIVLEWLDAQQNSLTGKIAYKIVRNII